MKTFLFALAPLFCSVAQAGTFTQLTVPQDVLRNGFTSCVGNAVSTDGSDTISGYCQSVTNRPQYRSSFIYTFSADTWDDNGNLISETYCGQLLTAGIFHLTYTYQPGFSAANCIPPLSYDSVLNQILIGNYWYAYVTTAADGSFELLMNGHYGTIYRF